MKAVIISEERLDELIQKCLDDTFRSPDCSKMAEKVDHRIVNYHLCVLKDAIKKAGLG